MRCLAIASAAVLLSGEGCMSDPWCVRPPSSRSSADYGAESSAVAATESFITGQWAAARAAPPAERGRFDGAARALGAEDAAELAAILAGDCLEERDLERFASARALSPGTAGRYLSARFGVRACARR